MYGVLFLKVFDFLLVGGDFLFELEVLLEDVVDVLLGVDWLGFGFWFLVVDEGLLGFGGSSEGLLLLFGLKLVDVVVDVAEEFWLLI